MPYLTRSMYRRFSPNAHTRLTLSQPLTAKAELCCLQKKSVSSFGTFGIIPMQAIDQIPFRPYSKPSCAHGTLMTRELPKPSELPCTPSSILLSNVLSKITIPLAAHRFQKFFVISWYLARHALLKFLTLTVACAVSLHRRNNCFRERGLAAAARHEVFNRASCHHSVYFEQQV
jgi:hypothetical protein